MKGRGIQLTDGILSETDVKIEVLRDENGLITQGLVVGDTLPQNKALIVVANPGEFAFYPTLGCAIDELLMDNDYLRMKHRITEHLQKDGMRVERVQVSDVQPLEILAYYE